MVPAYLSQVFTCSLNGSCIPESGVYLFTERFLPAWVRCLLFHWTVPAYMRQVFTSSLNGSGVPESAAVHVWQAAQRCCEWLQDFSARTHCAPGGGGSGGAPAAPPAPSGTATAAGWRMLAEPSGSAGSGRWTAAHNRWWITGWTTASITDTVNAATKQHLNCCPLYSTPCTQHCTPAVHWCLLPPPSSPPQPPLHLIFSSCPAITGDP